ncbi:hypothetical protein M501DRAFT_911988, partial [Patellaria atrata CBS 101060]
RSFIDTPFSSSKPQTLTASRSLPYPSSAIYNIIADVSSYSKFLPYCKSSAITRFSNADTEGKKWPELADIVVGYGGIEEKFTSRIYCVPGRVVEAVGGITKSQLPQEETKHHTHASSEVTPDVSDGLISHLLTRWTVRPYPYKPPPAPLSPDSNINPAEGSTNIPAKEQTEINLVIEFQFTNPVYNALSAAVAPKVAGYMIGAFEKRVKDVMEGPG